MKKKEISAYEELKATAELLDRSYRLSMPIGGCKDIRADAVIGEKTGHNNLINRYDNSNKFVFYNSDKQMVWAIAKLKLEACKL